MPSRAVTCIVCVLAGIVTSVGIAVITSLRTSVLLPVTREYDIEPHWLAPVDTGWPLVPQGTRVTEYRGSTETSSHFFTDLSLSGLNLAHFNQTQLDSGLPFRALRLTLYSEPPNWAPPRFGHDGLRLPEWTEFWLPRGDYRIIPLHALWRGLLADSAIFTFICAGVWYSVLATRTWSRLRRGRCLRCAHLLRGSDRCQECGHASGRPRGLRRG